MPTIDGGHVNNNNDDDDNNNNIPLRERSIDNIYRTVSQESKQQPPPSNSSSSFKKPFKLHDNHDESARTIGNPLSFYSPYQDSRESRYGADEERIHDAQVENTSNTKYDHRPNTGDRRRSILPTFFNRNRKKKTGGQLSNLNLVDQDSELAASERASKLITSLSIGSPSINIMASCLMRDDGGISRAPLLLSLLGLKVTPIQLEGGKKTTKFLIHLEYGLGDHRMKWIIERNVADLMTLHSTVKWKLKKKQFSKNPQMPKFPNPFGITDDRKRKVLDYIAENNLEQQQQNDQPPPTSSIDNHSIGSGQLSRVRSRLGSIASIGSFDKIHHEKKHRRNIYYIPEVEMYLKDLIELLFLGPISNLLFVFFELSPLSALLSYESGFQGKQGPVHISGSASSQGWRVGHFKANDLKGIYDRRTEKWLLVRNSYVMHVSDINSTTPLEVFLVDSKFKISVKAEYKDDEIHDEQTLKKLSDKLEETTQKIFPHLKITLENAERKLVISPKTPREHNLWYESLIKMKDSAIWSQPNRFNSFAPIRTNCFAQWFVDGRDYFWAVSTALEMAKDVIFIHDWWLSPELYLRRPANGNQQYRIDRLLQRKAQEGVKIYIIIYRNVGTTVATDSLYTKHSMLSLNEKNIHVIRSPNQLLQNTYFWAHHEKLCIIDQTYAFLGGIDLCYGRYDTPDHALTDDSDLTFDKLNKNTVLDVKTFAEFQTFPGKDYSNPRVQDFVELDKPYDSMYNRKITPRMPWHDVHMYTCGKIARDLSRHFVQRWNYLLRQKRPSRFTPLLIPPPDFTDEEAINHKMNGTCEVQLLRSSGNWSLGLQEHEQSIQNAYLKLIETSEHFVYIENQFFITSCFIDGIEIKNRLGDALVDRIIRAHQERTEWKAIIVIPLMPGFPAQVDEAEGSSVRVIMQCQYMSISRGETSIFAKLRKKGIDPDDYIQFFSLRKWGRIGPSRLLTTEQLYIHAKTMIVDDRAAIIGSANINERSMRGARDSEVAAIVRDTEMISTRMNGKPFKAAKFAHTLRMRLMREHLGISIDILDIVERRFQRFENFANTKEGEQFATNNFKNKEYKILSSMVEIATRDVLKQPNGSSRWKNFKDNISKFDLEISKINFEEENKNLPEPLFLPVSFNNRTGPFEANKGIRDKKKHSYDSRVQNSEVHKRDVKGDGIDKFKSPLAKEARISSAKFLKELSLKTMESETTIPKAFLPNLDAVLDFLNSDDHDLIDKMDEKTEEIINERNKERWLLLKKISYLQRIAAKEAQSIEEENRKRSGSRNSPPIGNNVSFDSNSSPTATNSNELNNSSDGIGTDFKDKYPTISLNDQAAKDLISSITTPEAKVSSFIDPYEFEDPVNPIFYEFLWNEFARRNTEIFRMVFHCQPDDNVGRWSEYTHYTKLQSKFMKSQASEIKKSTTQPVSRNSEETSEKTINNTGTSQQFKSKNENEASLEKNEQSRFANNSKIHYSDEDEESDVGVLGKVPQRKEQQTQEQQQHGHEKLRTKLQRRVSTLAGITEHPDGNLNEEEESDNKENEKEDENNQEEYKKEEKAKPKSNTTNHYTRIRKNRAGAALTRRRMQSGDAIYDKQTSEKLLQSIQGHLVYFPAEWLDVELENNNWFYNTDRLPPMEIYD
ncbi:unnamed protein product [Candida verbasci]|uniref:Phospholipase n=1 Tax=Candida verbasci TaxID=1227364 RepID=A0A9W4X948_9ASCO|nr:unnamed protein product [Candida verbasci]